jgi:hypothetical protein
LCVQMKHLIAVHPRLCIFFLYMSVYIYWKGDQISFEMRTII